MTPRALIPVLLLPLAGCATFVHSELDDGTKEGIRYSLPVPFLQVTPKPDGTIENSIVYLPDPQSTYVLRTKSLVSSYTLDVQLQNQMLKSVSLSSKSDAVAVALADSAANVAKTRIEADAKAEEESKKVDAAAAKALADAELAVRVANSKLKVLTDNKASADSILTAKIEKEAAIIKRDALLKGMSDANTGLEAANAPDASKSGKGKVVVGPLLFRIVPDGKGVKLIAAKGPTAFVTSDTPRALARFDVQPSGLIIVKADSNGVFQFDLTVNRTVEIEQPNIYAIANPGAALVSMRPSASKKADTVGSKVTITLDPKTPAGDYLILQPMTPIGTDTVGQQIEIRVIR